MRLLHTSDWHLGHLFHGQRRDEEFRAFLAWLRRVIREEKVDVLLVAGDVFDTNTPGNNCTRMYYDFLVGVIRDGVCRQTVLTGGNHDSPSFLNVPDNMFRAFQIMVFGGATADPADEVVAVPGDDGQIAMIIGAVPYLRDADLHLSNWGETPEEREAAQRRGFREHYRRVAEKAEELRAGRAIPFVLTGHFAAEGAHLCDNDGVREFVGGLKLATEADLPPADYVALGHIHQAQRVGGKEHIRYSGSPLRMSFADTREREVEIVEFSGKAPKITPILVPQTRRIVTLDGRWEEVAPELAALRDEAEKVCCRLLVTDLAPADLSAKLEEVFAETQHNYPLIAQSLLPRPENGRSKRTVAELRTMKEEDVFSLLLERQGITAGEERDSLLASFRQLLAEMRESPQ